jgi:hypothetical protein
LHAKPPRPDAQRWNAAVSAYQIPARRAKTVKEKECAEQPHLLFNVIQYYNLDRFVKNPYDSIDGSISVLQEHGELPPV